MAPPPKVLRSVAWQVAARSVPRAQGQNGSPLGCSPKADQLLKPQAGAKAKANQRGELKKETPLHTHRLLQSVALARPEWGGEMRGAQTLTCLPGLGVVSDESAQGEVTGTVAVRRCSESRLAAA